jgi:hypothetical protein
VVIAGRDSRLMGLRAPRRSEAGLATRRPVCHGVPADARHQGSRAVGGLAMVAARLYGLQGLHDLGRLQIADRRRMQLLQAPVKPLILGLRAQGEGVIQPEVLERDLSEGLLGSVLPGRVLLLPYGGGVDPLAQELAGVCRCLTRLEEAYGGPRAEREELLLGLRSGTSGASHALLYGLRGGIARCRRRPCVGRRGAP